MTNPHRVTQRLYELADIQPSEVQRDRAQAMLRNDQDEVGAGRLHWVQIKAKEATDEELISLLGHAQVLVLRERSDRACHLYLVRVYPDLYKMSSYAAKNHRAARKLLALFTEEALARQAKYKAAATQFAKALKKKV